MHRRHAVVPDLDQIYSVGHVSEARSGNIIRAFSPTPSFPRLPVAFAPFLVSTNMSSLIVPQGELWTCLIGSTIPFPYNWSSCTES